MVIIQTQEIVKNVHGQGDMPVWGHGKCFGNKLPGSQLKARPQLSLCYRQDKNTYRLRQKATHNKKLENAPWQVADPLGEHTLQVSNLLIRLSSQTYATLET